MKKPAKEPQLFDFFQSKQRLAVLIVLMVALACLMVFITASLLVWPQGAHGTPK
jgi:hypothetical protein